MNRYDIWKTAAPDDDDCEKQDPTVTVVVSLEKGEVSILADQPDFVRAIFVDYDFGKTTEPTVKRIEVSQLDDFLSQIEEK